MDRIGDAVRSELGRFGSTGPMADVVAAWPGAVGEGLAANAWPARIARDGTLHVATSSSVWAFELGHVEAEIRQRLGVALGSAAPPRLRFAVGRLPEAEALEAEALRRPAPRPSPRHVGRGLQLAAGIADEKLREAVARAAAAGLARAEADREVW